MNKQKFFDFLNRILYSSLFLWILLVSSKRFNIKLEINIILFFGLFIFLFLFIFPKQILISLILFLNRINVFLKISEENIKIESEKFPYLFFLFIRKLLKFFRGFSRFLKFIFTNCFFWFFVSISGIILDIFILKFISVLWILFLLILWILSIRHFKFKGKISVSLALIFLSLCPFLLIYKKEIIADKVANWIYIFLLIGLIQIFIDEINDKNDIK